MSVLPPQDATAQINTLADVCDENTGQKRGFKQQWRDFRGYFSQWKHAKVLFATAAAWFLL